MYLTRIAAKEPFFVLYSVIPTYYFPLNYTFFALQFSFEVAAQINQRLWLMVKKKGIQNIGPDAFDINFM